MQGLFSELLKGANCTQNVQMESTLRSGTHQDLNKKGNADDYASPFSDLLGESDFVAMTPFAHLHHLALKVFVSKAV